MNASNAPGRLERFLTLLFGMVAIAVLGIIDLGLNLMGQEVEP